MREAKSSQQGSASRPSASVAKIVEWSSTSLLSGFKCWFTLPFLARNFRLYKVMVIALSLMPLSLMVALIINHSDRLCHASKNLSSLTL